MSFHTHNIQDDDDVSYRLHRALYIIVYITSARINSKRLKRQKPHLAPLSVSCAAIADLFTYYAFVYYVSRYLETLALSLTSSRRTAVSFP